MKTNQKTIAEQIDEGKKVEVFIEYSYKNQKVTQKLTIDEEGTDNWMIYNPVNGWNISYYQGWSYQDQDKNIDADYEEILVDAIQSGCNDMDILDRVYDSNDGEIWGEVLLETDTNPEFLYELEGVPNLIKITMKVTYDVEE